MLKRIDAVFTAVTDKDYKYVLLVKSNGYWGFPGGAREEGETLIKAGEREILEETGLSVKLGELCDVSERISSEEHIMFFTFQATTEKSDKEFKLTGDIEISEVKWVTISEANKIVPFYPEGIENLIKKSASYKENN